MYENSYSEESSENNIKKEEIFDSLNINKNKDNETKKNQDNVSINNEDSIIEEAIESLSKPTKKDKNKNNNKKMNTNNNYSIDEDEDDNDNNKIKKSKGEDYTKTLKNNNDEENVNLGNSYSKISERDKYKNNEENNNKDVITPNTSIYNLSENLNENDINNVEISNKKNNIVNENKDKNQNNEHNKKEESSNIFEDDSLIYHKKENLSAVKNSINPNEEDNKFLYDLNIQFSKIGKPNENELNKNYISKLKIYNYYFIKIINNFFQRRKKIIEFYLKLL